MLIYIIIKEKGNPKKIYKTWKALQKIKSFSLFDEEYYLKKYPNIKESRLSPLDHYIYHGYKERKTPSKTFDGNYYLKKYPDVKNSNENPLIHYVLYGKEESRFKNEKDESQSPERLNLKLKKQGEKIEKHLKKIRKQRKQIQKHEKRLQIQEKEKKQIQINIKRINKESCYQKRELVDLKNELYKYTQIYKIKQINKERIMSEIENFKGCGITKEKRNPRLVVSLTSYPERMYDLHYTIYSLLKQYHKPDEILLWLSKEEFPNLEKDIPKKVLDLKKFGLSIRWCKNLKSYKKLIFALKEYPDDILITADDDLYYPKSWLEKLYKEHVNDPKNIICHRSHLIKFDDNKFKPYSEWKMIIQNNKASFLNFATTGGGNLYPPRSLYDDVLNEKLFMKLAPNGDDIWFWAMSVLNNTKIKIIEDGYNDIIYTNPKRELCIGEETTLFQKNKEGNNLQLKNIIEYYPQIINKLNEESYPKISVIIPIYNGESYLKECIDSVINQTLKDLEIICINDGSTDDSLEILEKYAKKDKRLKIINQKNQGAPKAINNGFKIATGEYIGFVDADDWVDLNFFETLYYEAIASDADIARTLYKYNWPDKEIEENHLNNLIREKNSKKELLGINDHSVVNWNAIYKRKFLEDNEINYYDNIYVYDVPFTTRATYFSKKTIPVVGNGFYHYRKEVKNQMTVFNLKRVLSANEANKISLEFINSHEYKNKEDYLVAFKRCIWRYDQVFHDALDLEEFDEKEQEKFFNEFVEEFKKCKYAEEFKEEYYEEYFKFMDKKLFKDYLNYKKKNFRFRKK